MLVLKSLIVLLLWKQSKQCEEFFMHSKDGGVTVGRSLEFVYPLDCGIMTFPKGSIRQADVPEGYKGKPTTWKSKYSVACASLVTGIDLCGDGMNSEGLSFSALVLQRTVYDYQDQDTSFVISNLRLGNWILDNFRSTSEVRHAIEKGDMPMVFNLNVQGMELPLHYSIVDSTGDAIVIEYLKDGRKIHNNTIHVLTNDPPFDYHMENIKNYMHLSKYNTPYSKLGDVNLESIGLGNGLLGLPGDLSPPSRFVKVAHYLHFANDPQVETTREATNLAFHILNAMDIPKGVDAVKSEKSFYPDSFDKTQAISVRDLKNKIMYFRTYEDQSIRKIDLNNIRMDRVGSLRMERDFLSGVEDVTKELYANEI